MPAGQRLTTEDKIPLQSSKKNEGHFMLAHLPETIIASTTLPSTTHMYAIIFDLDQETLRQTYGTSSHNNAYADIKKFLTSKGFEWQQGSAYFGKDIDAVKCVLAAQQLSKTFPWFAASVSDIRMLRIEENNDLRPAIDLGS
jgi:virulence-associated protein VapD